MSLFIAFHLALCVFLVAVILVQPGKSDGGIGFGSSSQSIFGSKGAGNFLTKTTTVVAFLFLATSFILTRARLKEEGDTVIQGTESSTPSASAPAVPPPAPATGTEPATKTAPLPKPK